MFVCVCVCDSIICVWTPAHCACRIGDRQLRDLRAENILQRQRISDMGDTLEETTENNRRLQADIARLQHDLEVAEQRPQLLLEEFKQKEAMMKTKVARLQNEIMRVRPPPPQPPLLREHWM